MKILPFARWFTGLAACLALLFLFSSASRASIVFETGGDVSELTAELATHGYYDSNGAALNVLTAAKANGWTTCRMRLMVNPNGDSGQTQSLSYDLALAKQIKAAGLKLFLDIFYSDTWADPAHQTTPAAWANENYPQLQATVYSYTQSVLQSFITNGTTPDYVQVGNEISNGMLWPVGSLSNLSQFLGLLQQGCSAVRATSPTSKIILQTNNGAESGFVQWFYTTIASQVDFDILGLSYYPSNDTTLSDISGAMDAYDGQFGNKPIMVVEFSYPYSYGVTSGGGYLNTPQGQGQCTTALISTIQSHAQGAGVIYWGGIWEEGWGTQTVFDSTNYWAMPAFYALGQSLAAVPVPNLQSAASVQEQAGTPFSVSLPLTGNEGVEGRKVGSTLQIVFTFDQTMTAGTAAVTSGTGTISGSPTFSGDTMTVNLTGVNDAQDVTLTVAGLNGTAGSAYITFGVLVGDVNGDGVVNSKDLVAVRNSLGEESTLSGFNPSADLNRDGAVSSQDLVQVRNHLGDELP